MKAIFSSAIAFFGLTLFAGTSDAQTTSAVEWKTTDGGNGHWYQLVVGNPISWTDARAAAQRKGGHLVSLTSESENAFAVQLANRADNPAAWLDDFGGNSVGPWLGGYQPVGASSVQPWAWPTGEAWNWTGWAPGEPNGGFIPGNGTTAMLGYADSNYYRGWADAALNDPYPYLTQVPSYITEWDADCNTDGKVDYGQIQRGELQDYNNDGVPDVCTYKPYFTIAVGNRPSGAVFDRTYIHVANDDDGTVSRISPKTGKVTLTYSANGHGSSIFFDGTYIWTANYRDNTVSKLTTGGVLKGTYALGSGPMRLAFDGTYIWATLPDAGRIVKINRSTGAIVGSYTAGPVPWGIISDGTYIWVVNGGSGNPGYLTKLSKTGALLASYDSGGTTAGSIATDGTFFYLTHYQSGNISKIRKATGAIEASFTSEPGIGDVFYEGHQLWVEGMSTASVLRINTSDMTLIERVPFPEGTIPGAISFDGVRVWVTGLNTASVSAF